MKKLFAAVLMSITTAAASAIPFGSQSVLVVEDDTGKILLEKNAGAVVPIASLTKLMTAMVIIDARQNMDELIEIDQSDVDTFKHSTSRVPVGASIPRRDVLQLALMSSDNRAAASLARTFPGGPSAFRAAVKHKIVTLGMKQTRIEEATGLSPNNISTASDLAKMAAAAAKYPEIARMTTEKNDIININGRGVEYRNTNRLVGAKGWDIGLSKTGYTNEAGRCLIMNITAAGKNATVILLNAGASSVRILDALNIRRFMTGDTAPVVARAAPRALKARPASVKFKASSRVRVKATSRASAKASASKVKATARARAKDVKPRRRNSN